MPDVTSLGPGATVSWDDVGDGSGGRPKTKAEAAKAFEALLIGQMLKSARESGTGGGWLGSEEDSSGESVREFAEQQFAQMIASGGGFGLSKLIQDGLARGKDAPSSPVQSGGKT